MVKMLRRIPGTAGGRAARAILALASALAVAGLAALTAGPATASSSAKPASAAAGVEAVWNISGVEDVITQPCDDPGPVYYGPKAAQVYNTCSGRVWLHYDDTQNSRIYTFCVSPHALAYDFPYPFTDIQVTTNTAPCDVGKKFTVHWVNAIGKIDNQAYDCQSNAGVTLLSKFTAGAIGTNCDFRIWVHVGDDGSGDSACVDPNPNLVVDQGSNFPNPHEFYQVQQTYIEAPCNAGAAPYPY
jgi:hypothetical protein